ncbi:hypothetical protein Pelo_15650 [Pelomyxa schiedti]|nr:hypothetical protein Pelo_15650 [Pelomyxa schiedti]
MWGVIWTLPEPTQVKLVYFFCRITKPSTVHVFCAQYVGAEVIRSPGLVVESMVVRSGRLYIRISFSGMSTSTEGNGFSDYIQCFGSVVHIRFYVNSRSNPIPRWLLLPVCENYPPAENANSTILADEEE